MNLDLTTQGPVLIVEVCDQRIDASNVGGFREQLDPHLAQGLTKVLIDVAGVDFVDSTGLGALISLFKRLPASGMLGICGATERVEALLKLTRLNKVFNLFPSLEAGIAAMDSQPQ